MAQRNADLKVGATSSRGDELRHEQDDNERIDLNLDDEAAGESPPNAGRDESPEAVAEALAEQLAKLQAEKDDLYQTLVRRQADFENYRKRIERDRQEDGRRANAMLVDALLPVLDAFERALAGHAGGDEQYRLGFELIYKQLSDALARSGLERIAAKGELFDPFVHQAVERVETSEVEDGTIIEELQPGYKYKGTVLRPSMVRVAARPGGAGAGDSRSVVN
ncbi:MAG: nucleotide exchange factor GrpE [Candidatus Acidiferrales bacterium]